MYNLLTGISEANSALLEHQNIDNGLNIVVASLGTATQVDRCYIFQNRKDADEILRLYYMYEWCNDGIDAYIGNPELNGHSYDVFPGLYEALSEGRPLYGKVSESDNIRFKEVMEMQGILTYLFVPIFCNATFWGWMGYDNCSNEREWRQEEVDAIYTVAKNIGLRLSRDLIEADYLKTIERFNLSIQSSQQGLWEWDMVAQKFYASPIYMNTIGYQHMEAEHSYENWRESVHPDDINQVEHELHLYLSKQQDQFKPQYRIRHKKGPYIWIQASGIARWNKEGKPEYMIGSHLDISELKQQQAYLQDQRNEFNQLLNGLGEAVFRLNSQLELTYLNEYWIQLSMYSKEEAISKTLEQFISPADWLLLKELLEKLKKQRTGSDSLDVKLIRNDGSERWVQLLASAYVHNESKTFFIAGSIVDIHNQKIAEQKQKELNEMKDHFITLSSHQFRTPLTIIFSNVELMELYARKTDPVLGERISTSAGLIRNEIDRMSSLMNNILLMGSYNAQQLQCNLVETDLISLTNNVINTYFSNQTDGRAIHTHTEGHRKSIMLDRLMITHVLSNIIDNAFKYSQNTANPEIHISYKENWAHISVRDYGMGIPQDEQEKVFDSFYRASNAITFRGSGLGLVVARQFMELHKGKISLQSKTDDGTTVDIAFPI